MNQQSNELPLFSKAADFLTWLMQITNHFPRIHRQTVTRRLLDAALNFQELIIEANDLRGQMRKDRLNGADTQLNKVRLYLRLVHQWHWLSMGQYEHGSRLVAELGRLLGAWQKITEVK